ncbi:MAG: hypothetical protein FJ302_20380 [Planctomycetes bacterium]|nr:hypothetical protein [Planctomycetota bacterium]
MRSRVFALAEFAEAYRDQIEHDHAALVDAERTRRVAAMADADFQTNATCFSSEAGRRIV